MTRWWRIRRGGGGRAHVVRDPGFPFGALITDCGVLLQGARARRLVEVDDGRPRCQRCTGARDFGYPEYDPVLVAEPVMAVDLDAVTG